MANEITKLTRAPILEALIDIQCSFVPLKPHDQAIAILKQKADSLKADFEEVTQLSQNQLAFSNTGVQATASTTLGFILKSSKNGQAVQFRRNGFTYSKLPPYSNWENLISQAKKFWSIYSASNEDQISVNRLATRYVNRINVSLPLKTEEKGLVGLGSIFTDPQDISQVSGFVNQFVSTDAVSKASVGLVRMMPQVLPDATSADIIVDIDVFRNVSGTSSVSQQIWDIIETFREVKNRVFFRSVGSDIINKYK